MDELSVLERYGRLTTNAKAKADDLAADAHMAGVVEALQLGKFDDLEAWHWVLIVAEHVMAKNESEEV